MISLVYAGAAGAAVAAAVLLCAARSPAARTALEYGALRAGAWL